MASAYFDLPFALGLAKPYLGGGIGYGRNKMDPIRWSDGTTSGVLPGGSSSGVVWQLSGGVEIPVAQKVTLELGYRYSDLGKIKKDAGPDLAGQFNPPPNGTGSATGNLRANEILLGLRYAF
jgi:opacity protein-like surface antigen